MNKDNIEIERRFILAGKPSQAPAEEYHIFQKYATSGWRYRKQLSPDSVTFYKTRKSVISPGVNNEEEYVITEEDFEYGCGEIRAALTKTRTVYQFNGLRFEVDSFHDLTLVIMEVELDAIEQEFIIPDFLQALIIYEITGIGQFSNSMLARPLV